MEQLGLAGADASGTVNGRL